jgi:hypothetical protein
MDRGTAASVACPPVTRADLKRRLREVMQAARDAAGRPATSREQLLALSEYARRHAGDIPGGGELRDLTLFELRVFSQNGEDGVIAEILRRTGAPGRYFVEIGAGDGIECNCAALADLVGWRGLFVEASDVGMDPLRRKYGANARVQMLQAMVMPGNVEELLTAQAVPDEPDLLSIDVDGSEYWIWQALERRRPRVVVVEYNGSLPPGRRLVQPRDKGAWDHTDFAGASLDALVTLGAEKGYRLVHCELTGNNAFFVREDVPGDFPDPSEVPHRAANHWLSGGRHPPDHLGREYVDLDA